MTKVEILLDTASLYPVRVSANSAADRRLGADVLRADAVGEQRFLI
jgi:hypothetical protein